MWWMASRTTMPSSSGTVYSLSSPPEASPRKTCITASAMLVFLLGFHRGGLGLEQRAELVGHRGQGRLGNAHFLAVQRGHAVDRAQPGIQIGMIQPRVRAAAFLALERAPGDRFADREQVP